MKMVRVGSLVVLFLISTGMAQAQHCCEQPGRIESAKELIQEAEKFQNRAEKLHLRLAQATEQAKALKGRASQLQVQMQSHRSNLTGPRLAAAKAQYAKDLADFKSHATQYASHLDRFRAEIGECHDNDKEYEAQLKRYQMHVERFHMPDIVPPRICGELDFSERESARASGQLVADAKRMQKAEADLADAERKLQGELFSARPLESKALKANVRALEERKIAEEFARLHEEYETLAIEHDALHGSKTTAAVSSANVHGKLKR